MYTFFSRTSYHLLSEKYHGLNRWRIDCFLRKNRGNREERKECKRYYFSHTAYKIFKYERWKWRKENFIRRRFAKITISDTIKTIKKRSSGYHPRAGGRTNLSFLRMQESRNLDSVTSTEWQKQVEPLGVEILRHQNKSSIVSVILTKEESMFRELDPSQTQDDRASAFGGTSWIRHCEERALSFSEEVLLGWSNPAIKNLSQKHTILFFVCFFIFHEKRILLLCWKNLVQWKLKNDYRLFIFSKWCCDKEKTIYIIIYARSG